MRSITPLVSALLVAALALSADLVLSLVQRLVVSPGITGRARRPGATPTDVSESDSVEELPTGAA